MSAFATLLIRGTRYTLALSMPVTIAAMILARPLIVAWVGRAYATLSGPAQLFLTYQLLSCTATIALTILIGIGRMRGGDRLRHAGSRVNLIVSIALAKPLGVSGVIIGTLVGYGITAPLYIRLVLRGACDGDREHFSVRAILPIAAVGCRLRRCDCSSQRSWSIPAASSRSRSAASPPGSCTSLASCGSR